MTLPIDFEAKARQAKQASGGGYPVQLSAADLMRNFVFATEDFDTADFSVTTTQGPGGHTSRTVALANPLPTLPASGTHVLGVVDGTLTWIATEEC